MSGATLRVGYSCLSASGVTGVLILALSLPCRFAKGIYQRLPRPSAKGSSREPLIPSCSPREREMAGFRVKRSISQRRGERPSSPSLTCACRLSDVTARRVTLLILSSFFNCLPCARALEASPPCGASLLLFSRAKRTSKPTAPRARGPRARPPRPSPAGTQNAYANLVCGQRQFDHFLLSPPSPRAALASTLARTARGTPAPAVAVLRFVLHWTSWPT